MILRSKLTKERFVPIGDRLQLYHKFDRDKNDEWSQLQFVVSVDAEFRWLIVFGAQKSTSTVAFDNVRLIITLNDFAQFDAGAVIELKGPHSDAAEYQLYSCC